MKYIVSGIFATILMVSLFSCKENSLEKQRKRELNRLNEFIGSNYSHIDPKPSGLYYIEQKEGIGDSIKINDRIQIFYDLYTIDSMYVYGTGSFEPAELVVLHPGQLSYSADYVTEMKGLHEALTYMKKGTKASLVLPSQLAFGQYGGYYGIGGFKTLLMELEVYKVFPSSEKQ